MHHVSKHVEMQMKLTALAATAAALIVSVLALTRPGFADAQLTSVDRTTARKVVGGSQKPVVLLVVTDNCGPCQIDEALLASAAEKHPEFKFVKIDAGDAGMAANLAPAVVVLSQGWARSYEAVHFQPDGQTLESFLRGRTDYFAQRAKTQQSIADAKAALEAKQRPYKAKIDDIAVEMNADSKAELATYDSDSHDLAMAVMQHGMSSAEANVARKQLWADKATLDQKNQPFFDRIKEVQTQMDSGCAQEQANLKTAEDALKSLEETEWAAGGPKQ
jgi:thiol-disulfide isomerase/thioredoxin